jgi:hypothetical protein
VSQKFTWVLHEKQFTVTIQDKKTQYLVSNLEKSSVTLHDTTMQPEQIVTFTKD